jgi:cell division cycle protein 20 (cofactor of APC complex)
MIKAGDIADFESMLSLDKPITSSVLPRWQRKQLAEKDASSDRFIPCRSATDLENSQNSFFDDRSILDSDDEHKKILASSLAGKAVDADLSQTRILSYKNKAPAPKDGYQNSLAVLYSQNGVKKSEIAKPTRHIPSAPVRILDAPDMLDDYYLNLLSWSCTNTLAVALSSCVYLWDASSGNIKELMNVDNTPNDYISSVSWIQNGGTHLAIGTASNTVQLWDVQAGRQVRSMDGHAARVGALAWNGPVLTSGSKDTTIINHDVRVQNHIVNVMRQHTQEVCGLSWSPDGTFLASGANDNTLCIWDSDASGAASSTPRHVLTEHQAAVKALAWSPHERNLLASGGGTADRCIKFWNAASGAMVNSVDTGSQVCALQWSPFEKEILSSHGFAENQLCLWKYPTLARTKELKGHTSRVLHLAMSPDGSTVVSGAADETLRFWNVFASEGKKKPDTKASSVESMVMQSARANGGTMRIR